LRISAVKTGIARAYRVDSRGALITMEKNKKNNWLRYIPISVFFVVGQALPQQAQTTHQHPQPAIIDGSAHPELISDLTAYRLWLVSVSRGPSPTALEATHQQAQIDKVGVRDADRKTLISTLTTFNIQYQNLIKSFNTEAKAAWATGESPDTAAFLLQRDQIVQSTIDELKTHLGGSGWANLTAHVNREKAHMRINMEVAQ
jgi:hypothetical protein